MAIRTQADIARDMKAWLEARLRVVDTGTNTVLYSLMLQALSKVLGDAYSALESAEAAQGIGSPADVDPDDLDAIAYNLSLSRKAPSAASGFVTFRRATVPAVNIRIGAEDGSGGIVVGTGRDAGGASVTFVTTQTVFFTPSATQDAVSGLFEVSAPVIAVQPGTSGNKDAGTVTALVSPAQGATSVTNKTATAGGKDRESNVDFAARLVSKLLGFQPGIVEGLRTIALSQNGVLDASVVGPDDSEFQRSLVGAVDLVIKGSALATGIDQFPYNGSAWTFQNRPVTNVNSVISTVGLTQSSLVQGAQYGFSQDTTSESRYSGESTDGIGWQGPAASLPNAGATVTATYTYDALVNTVQGIVNQDDKHYPSASVLVKRGQQVFLTLTFSVSRTGAVGQAALANNIATAISNYVANLGLGETVSQSAVVAQIKAVAGIRQLVLPFTQFSRRGAGGADDIELTKYEYPAVDAQSISITFTN